MQLIELPKLLQNKGFKGWPEVYQVGKDEPRPPVGISYIVAEEIDMPLIFRLFIPLLMKQHPYFDWIAVYEYLTGKLYYEQRIYFNLLNNGTGLSYGNSQLNEEMMTLFELSADQDSYINLDVLETLGMIPTFMTDIRLAITANITNSFMWTDGYNKKLGICSGYLTEQPMDKSLIILDISKSIPDGVSSGMMALIKTMSDIVNADLILTGGTSYFYTRDEVRTMDIHKERKGIPRSNESDMFRAILMTHDMNYKNVITFGDSDNPGWEIYLPKKVNIERWYSFFTGTQDTYGNNYIAGVGYGRWVLENVPNVQVIHNTEWSKFFTK